MAQEERLAWLRAEAAGALRQFLARLGAVVPTTGHDPHPMPAAGHNSPLMTTVGQGPPLVPMTGRDNPLMPPAGRGATLDPEGALLPSEYGAVGPARQAQSTSRRSERELRALAKEIKRLIT